MKYLLASCLLVLGTVQATFGQNVEDLLGRLEKLEKRVQELEAAAQQHEAKGPTVQPAVLTEVPAAPHAIQDAGVVNQESHPEYPLLHIAGFTDINFSASDQRGSKSGFTAGQFTMHFTSALSPRVNFFGEVTFNARPDAGQGMPAATGFNAEVERSIIRFDRSDRFKVSFGRYHTPINYWNTAYHHGQWLQTTVSRPEMVQFGGRLLPVHFVGALVEGAVPAGGLNLNYNVGLGNGRGTVISRGGDAGDINNNRAWLTTAFIKPDKLYGLQVGGSAYHDMITQAGGRQFPEWITAAHIVWTRETPEVIAEVANVHHREAGRPNTAYNSIASYVQTGYRLPGIASQWKPYYRFEYIHIPKSDPVFQGLPNLAGSVAGLRYDISSFAALKFEYRNQRRVPGQPRINIGFLQTSFTF